MSSQGGRPRLPYLRADMKISLPAVIAAEMDLLLEDPVLRKPKYGARSKLIECLLQRWLAEVKGGEVPPMKPLSELREGT